MSLDYGTLTRLASEIRENLTSNVIPFWQKHTRDNTYGGYLTDLDAFGHALSHEKNIWMQARQVWMFSRTYQQAMPDKKLRELIDHGVHFLMSSKAYAGSGRWNYLLSDDGTEVLQGAVSIYSDAFALMALCAYHDISKDPCVLPRIMETYEALEHNLRDPGFVDVFPQVHRPGMVIHGVPMIALNALWEASPTIGKDRTRPLRQHCARQVMEVCFEPRFQCIMENRYADGSPVPQENLINVGHNFEAIWFLLQQAGDLGLPESQARALDILPGLYERANDGAWGGVLFVLDAVGGQPDYQDWNRTRHLQWDEKVWWTHAEALCALAAHHVATGDAWSLAELELLWNYCSKHFVDRTHGEWYSVLTREGHPRIKNKGGLQKAAFHVPRGLLTVSGLLQTAVSDQTRRST